MNKNESHSLKRGMLHIRGDSPLEITELGDQDVPSLSDEEAEIVEQVGATIKAYLQRAEELLNSKLAHLRGLTPDYLADPGNVLVVCCEDGVVIRYERKVDERHTLISTLSQRVIDVAPMLSQNIIHCYSDRNYTSIIPTTGAELKLRKQNINSQETEDIMSARIGFDVVVERADVMPQPPQKPFCLLSVRNTFELQLVGELIPVYGNNGGGQPFLARSQLRLPMAWECIEIYPFFDLNQWKPEYAQVWAETDLLAAVVAQQFRNAQLESLDPKAAARREYAELLHSFKKLLDSNPEREEILQIFLQDNPELLCPTQIKVWPKLTLGARKTDFVFLEAAGDYLLVELERSTLKLFLADGHQSHQLTHARDQILDWKRYLEDNLATVQRELGVEGISTNPNSLIVMGRSQSLTSKDRRQLTTIENESPKLKIMTYDDVYENAKAVVENLLGPIWHTSGNTQIYYLKNPQN